MKASQFLRFFIPRRLEKALNVGLTLLLVGVAFYYWSRVDRVEPRSLPTRQGQVWPTTTVPPHTRPQPGLARTGPGENGRGVHLTGREKERSDREMVKWFMSVIASDKISLDRSIPDSRPTDCHKVKYDTDLPKASVVIIFTDEAWSPLMRTVHSVVNRSPPEHLLEVVLVDDFTELKGKLDNYIKRFRGLVRLARMRERQGLIRAKLNGARLAKGDVVVFLDSHCEANQGWLEPILQRIKDNQKAVVCPVIDHIDHTTFEYSGGGAAAAVGGFWWSLHFRWDSVPDYEMARRKSQADYIRSPTMAGGLLAANRQYFLDVGGYDPGMDIWGGENLEISFRVWMCGGSIEFLPCSRVGHVFRDGHPYNMTGPNGNKDVHGTNSKRLAEVWMDDYKRLYYLHRRDLKDKYVGDLSERMELRKRLNCKSFKWYLDNVARSKFILDEDSMYYGTLMNKQNKLCLDTLQRNEKSLYRMGVFYCQSGSSSAQFVSLTPDGQLRRELSCAIIETPRGSDFSKVQMIPCGRAEHNGWTYDKSSLQIRFVKKNVCLDGAGLNSGDDLRVQTCTDPPHPTQQWLFEHENVKLSAK